MKNYRMNITLKPNLEIMLRKQAELKLRDMSEHVRQLIVEEDKRQKK